MPVYFTQFPKSQYQFPSSIPKLVTNISVYTAIFSRIADDISFYTYYNARPDERLDNISQTLYNTPAYYWTIPLINPSIVNTWTDLPKSTPMMTKYVSQKYPGSALIVDESDDQVGKFTLDELGVYDSTQVVRIIGKYPTQGYIHVVPVPDLEPSEVVESPTLGVLIGADSNDSVQVSAQIPAYLAPQYHEDQDGNRVLSTVSNAFEAIILDAENQRNEDTSRIKVIRREFIYEVSNRFEDELRATREQILI